MTCAAWTSEGVDAWTAVWWVGDDVKTEGTVTLDWPLDEVREAFTWTTQTLEAGVVRLDSLDPHDPVVFLNPAWTR